MPTYPYRCPDCGHDFDLFQKISDEPKASCPKCSSTKPERQIAGGSAMFQFKGSGFYETDYKNKGDQPPSSSKGGCCPCGKPPGGGGCSS